MRDAERAAAAAEEAAEEAELCEREAWEAERLANELLEEAEQKKDDEDGENLLPESAPKAPFANNTIAFNRGSKAKLS